MKKIIFSLAFAFFASLSFAQKKDDVIAFQSDFGVLNPAFYTDESLKKVENKRGKKNAVTVEATTKIKPDAILKNSYQMADGSTLTWILIYDKKSKAASFVGFENSAVQGGDFVKQELPANFWEKAQQSLTKGDEANQKLSIEALLKQAYK